MVYALPIYILHFLYSCIHTSEAHLQGAQLLLSVHLIKYNNLILYNTLSCKCTIKGNRLFNLESTLKSEESISLHHWSQTAFKQTAPVC